jgi:hypothetical protein
MIRRNFLKGLSLLGAGSVVNSNAAVAANNDGTEDQRAYWVNTLTRITSPVLESLSQEKLKARMPVEAYPNSIEGRKKVTYLEAFGRSMAGLAPWLELGPEDTPEGKIRTRFIRMATASLQNAVNPSSLDYMNFAEGSQPLVDAAFLAHALLRAPKQLWGNLDRGAQGNIINALKATRIIKPYYSNWLLFTAMIEAALLKFAQEYDAVRVDYALKQHEIWYKGDGVYGDGPDFHFDYYNSYVIQPMMLDIVKTVVEENGEMKDEFALIQKRAKRYAEIQERLISPEGTFPPIGRSIAYRCGAFQLLAQMALQKQLPDSLQPAQIRSALSAVISKTMYAAGTFDKDGWLSIGLAGHQPEVGEPYISTGSLYLCSVAFLPLGLPATDEFWSSPSVEWTSKKAFSGKNFPIDKALK